LPLTSAASKEPFFSSVAHTYTLPEYRSIQVHNGAPNPPLFQTEGSGRKRNAQLLNRVVIGLLRIRIGRGIEVMFDCFMSFFVNFL
jgi:hypothetical protein